MLKINSIISEKWKKILHSEFSKGYFKSLNNFLIEEYKNYTVYPKKEHIFAAINKTEFEKVKIVIIGQDPYHGKNQANGIAFSVNDNITNPPSLKNILKELADDLNKDTKHVNLVDWANQGVLLLNSILTVRESFPGSHKNKGWEIFTDFLIESLVNKRKNLIFIIWGAQAKKKITSIDLSNHYILESPHPSPLSSYRGFFGCKHFSKANKILRNLNKKEIKWI
jgi:uracil-DNA glycosylase|tara:strand:+ start:5481 stop:6152 length:672 start_codon:yes stop_codon:yes gene_type:complete